MTQIPDIDTVRDYLTGLQDRICTAIEDADGSARFVEDRWERAPADGNAHGMQRIAGGRRREFGVGYGGVPTAAATCLKYWSP